MLILMDAEINHNSDLWQITLIKQCGEFKEKFLWLSKYFIRENTVRSCDQDMLNCNVFTWMGRLYELQLAGGLLMSPHSIHYTGSGALIFTQWKLWSCFIYNIPCCTCI